MDLVRVLMVGNLTRDAQLLPTAHGPVVRLRVSASSTQLVNGMIEPRTVTMTLEVRGLTEREARALAAAHPRGARVVAEGRLENRKTQRRVTATLADGTSVETQAEVVETIVVVDHVLSGGAPPPDADEARASAPAFAPAFAPDPAPAFAPAAAPAPPALPSSLPTPPPPDAAVRPNGAIGLPPAPGEWDWSRL